MANRIESNSETGKHPLIALLGFVILVGALLSWWGTRDHRDLFGEPPREPVVAGEAIVTQNNQSDSARLVRGSQLEQEECAGCHEMVIRSSGPSYREIVTFYRRTSAPSAGNEDLFSKLAAAVAHPQPGWTNFAPGPVQPGLSLEDRVALASWILNGFDQKRDASEGAGK